jgi:predicted alpha/beta superfamily hydrolase
MKSVLTTIVLFVFLVVSTSAQLTLHITSLPASTPANDSIFLAGNIGGWNPADKNYRFKKGAMGHYWLQLDKAGADVEFKITRGSWNSAEGNETGGFIPNRRYSLATTDTLHLSVLSWEDLDGTTDTTRIQSTANSQVFIWDTSMYMPQLNRNRRIWVYLPQDYFSSDKQYKVLYMHDGQNVFDASTSFSGEWQVDETLTALENQGYETSIVVAIDNGGSKRIDELTPFIHPEYGGGETDAYLDFIVETLKPKVDSCFRTLQNPQNTALMGSSLGGLVSHYAYFRDPEVFGRIGIFSPAYWIAEDIYSYTSEKEKVSEAKLYILAGALEDGLEETTNQMTDTLRSLGYSDKEVFYIVAEDGEHNEWFWAREFEQAYKWLFEIE